jgi:hypothetical protein
MKKPRKSKIDAFIALSDTAKNRVVKKLEAETPAERLSRSRPLSAAERKQYRRFKAKIGRPPVGKGARTISLTVERELLEQADAYAKRHGLTRAKLVAQGLKTILGSAA